ncbi:MAG: hypothetical protein HQRvContig03_4 [Haloquadratum phage sp.]|nr:MAG: hypothetical protein HQRvContig03_4 [Haloquadratum phage sp.]
MTDDATLVEETDADTAELADELFRVAEDTTADGRVRVEIRDVSKVVYPERDPEIAVTVRRPSMEEFTEQMAYPERDDPEYKFVRLCREAGYSLAAAEQLEGATVLADNDSGWSLVAEREPTRREQLSELLDDVAFTGLLTLGFLTYPAAVIYVMSRQDGYFGMFTIQFVMFSSLAWAVMMLIVVSYLGVPL